jgi:hypothetical protein
MQQATKVTFAGKVVAALLAPINVAHDCALLLWRALQ